MELENRNQQFIIIGENIHTTRVVLRKGKLVTIAPDGSEAVRYTAADGLDHTAMHLLGGKRLGSR